MKKIDLNCDMGESFGAYLLGMDKELMPYISSANIACGFHAGDSLVMAKTVEQCMKHGVSIGAHPGFPDLQGFGRRNMAVSPEEAAAYVTYQVGALAAFCKSMGTRLNHVKPHGALYNMAAKDMKLSLAICGAIHAIDPTLIIMAPFGSQTLEAAKSIGMPCAAEVFADRAYMADGALVPRGQAGAMITNETEAVRRVVSMVLHGQVESIEGTTMPILAETVCVHGDNAHALEFVLGLRQAFEKNSIDIATLK